MSKPLGHTVNGARCVATAHQDAFNHNGSHNSNGMASGIPFTYDPIGNRTSASETIGGETLLKSYTANKLNQYTTIANPAAVGLRGDATNSAVVTVNGESVQSDNIASDTVPWHFALEADNANGPDFPLAEIVAVVNPPGTNTPDIVSTASGHLYAPPQTETLTYDDDGNMLSDGRWHYTLNGENRLIEAEELLSPTNRQPYTVKYAYDHRGRMVWKQISTNAVVVSTHTLHWDGYNIIRETINHQPSTTNYYVWGLDLSGTLQGAGGVGGLLSVVRDGETSFQTYDANGNITEYLSADGTIVAHYEYSPFGEIVVQSGDLADSFTHRFSTKPWCPVTGLSEYQYRKYSPLLGRWISRDPIGEVGGFLLYGFTQNNLISRWDYLGWDCCELGNVRDPKVGLTTVRLLGNPNVDNSVDDIIEALENVGAVGDIADILKIVASHIASGGNLTAMAFADVLLSSIGLSPDVAAEIAGNLSGFYRKRGKETQGVRIWTRVCYEKCVGGILSIIFGNSWEETCDPWQKYQYERGSVTIDWWASEEDAATYMRLAYEKALEDFKKEHNFK